MSVLAYIPLHYGAEYLEASIKSVIPCVDKLLILYTASPSYGHYSSDSCPETQDQLKEIAFRAAGDKIHWLEITGQVNNESEHRNAAREYAKIHGFDQVLAVDADEVWDTEVLQKTLKEAENLPNDRVAIRNWTHFWRSFNWCCKDWFLPVRIYNLKAPFNKEEGVVEGCIYHFGYAQSPGITSYKLKIHGHKSELRDNWFEDIFLNWTPGINKVHPVSLEIWDPEPFDKNTLPEILKQHPNFSKWMI